MGTQFIHGGFQFLALYTDTVPLIGYIHRYQLPQLMVKTMAAEIFWPGGFTLTANLKFS